jgi:hypothetical protein
MTTKYILITKLNPLETEFTDLLLKPETEKSLYVIKLNSSFKPEKNGETCVLKDLHFIEVLDKSANKAGLHINNRCITNIEYDFEKHNIAFIIDEGLNILRHQIDLKRMNPEIRNDIVRGIKFISEIPYNKSILTINEIL